MHNSAMMRPSNEAAEPDWLQAAVSELSRHEAEPAVFSNQLSGLVTNLMQSGVKLPAEALDPLFATLERHVAAPIAQINLGDFARLAQAANQLWMVSGRDMALGSITEHLATRFGRIAGALKVRVPQFDAIFDRRNGDETAFDEPPMIYPEGWSGFRSYGGDIPNIVVGIAFMTQEVKRLLLKGEDYTRLARRPDLTYNAETGLPYAIEA